MFKTAHPNYPGSFTAGEKQFGKTKITLTSSILSVKKKSPVFVIDYIRMNMENHYGVQVGVLGVVLYMNLCWIK